MKNKKYSSKRWVDYSKMRKRFIAGASGSILASMLFVGGATAFADTVEYSAPNVPSQNASIPNGMHMMHRFNSVTKINSLASQLGISSDEIKTELQSGKTLKQILQERGIVPGQLERAFSARHKSKKSKKSS